MAERIILTFFSLVALAIFLQNGGNANTILGTIGGITTKETGILIGNGN